MTRFASVLVGLLFVAAPVCARPVTAASPEHLKLAAIDLQSRDVSDAVAREYLAAYERLRSACYVPGGGSYSDVVVKTVSLRAGRGVRASNLETMASIASSAAALGANPSCLEAAAAVVAL